MKNTCKVTLRMCELQGTFNFLFIFMTEMKLHIIFISNFICFFLAKPYETRSLPFCTIC